MGDLKPCPFCGGAAEIIHIDGGENTGGSCVCCTQCNASGNVEFGFKENFVGNWNRRVDPAAEITRLRGLLDQAREALAGLEEANNRLASVRSHNTYQSMEADTGGRDALFNLQDARTYARTVLAAIDAEQGGHTDEF